MSVSYISRENSVLARFSSTVTTVKEEERVQTRIGKLVQYESISSSLAYRDYIEMEPTLKNRQISIVGATLLPLEFVNIILQYFFDVDSDEDFDDRDLDILISPEENSIEYVLQKSIELAVKGGQHAWNYIGYLIIKLCADVNSRYPLSSHDIQCAAREKDLQKLTSAIQARSKYHIRGNPLQWAVIFNDSFLVECLLEKRLNKDGKRYIEDINNNNSALGRTPLHWAALFGLKYIAEVLEEHGASWYSIDAKGFMPRQYNQSKRLHKRGKPKA